MINNNIVIKLFEEINQIPRCSGNEKYISDWLVEYGKKQGWEIYQDDVLNVVLRVPGRGELSSGESIIIQGHMDMVGVKEEGSLHDFTKDPIMMFEEDGWLKAKGTTLGADNGIAIAIALAIATEKNISHPPLELLFTVDEERGLTGARELKSDVLKGKYLINIDSEDEGVFTIGCAGGRNTLIDIPLVYEENISKNDCYKLSISRLSGGHSGIQINENKPNAIKIVTDVVHWITKNTDNFNLCSINAGVAHNAIPTNATICFSSKNEPLVKIIKKQTFDEIERDFRAKEPQMELSFEKIEPCERYIRTDISQNIIKMLMDLPHGVFSLVNDKQSQKTDPATQKNVSPELSSVSQTLEPIGHDEIVETSNNLAQVDTDEDKLRILISLRSSKSSQMDVLYEKIEDISQMYGANCYADEGYPAWEPDWESELLTKSKVSYKNIYGTEPEVEVIHAGLECGVIGAKYPEMQMISIGPTIKAPHTPNESLKIKDIDKIISFLLELFKNI
ncbi:MAG: beta-Ala-His dipeptidase [Candidatus Cloacimonetes bacterium]|nr:beta-Ala-His dipeptidase [Candidatus Cloacimonadota bacterium]